MAQSYGGQMPKKVPDKVRAGIDIGAYAVKVYLSEIPDSAQPSANLVNYPLEFRTARAKTTELDTTLVFSGGELHFAYLGGLTHTDGHVFRDYKLATLGLQPFARILAEDCDLLSAPGKAPFTPANLFRAIFAHIYEKVQSHLYRKYGSRFDEIECVVTYPVSHSRGLQIVLLQEASAAGFKVVESVSESMAIVFALHSEKAFTPQDGASLVFDMGAATMDVAVACVDDEGKLVQICPSDGLPIGGSQANRLLFSWLHHEYPDWELDEETLTCVISPQFDDCKASFNGERDKQIRHGKSIAVIVPDVMKSFFEPLLADALKLIKRSLAKARAAKYDVRQVFVCGGGFGNDWFFKDFFRRLLDETEVTACERIQESWVVAEGALCYARSDFVEECVAAESLAFTYLGNYTRLGNPLKPGKMYKGLAWVLPRSNTPESTAKTWNVLGQESGSYCLDFLKEIEFGSIEEGDQMIETELWASPANSQTFEEEYIGENDLIIWPCGITYPASKKLFSQLSHLGTFSGKIPHEEFFPPGTEETCHIFKFRLELRPDPNSHLMKGFFSGWTMDGRLIKLGVRFIPLPLVPRSHYEHQICFDQRLQTLDNSFEAPLISEQRRQVSPEVSLSPRLPRTAIIRPQSQSNDATRQGLLASDDATTAPTQLVTSDHHRKISPRPGSANQSRSVNESRLAELIKERRRLQKLRKYKKYQPVKRLQASVKSSA